MVTWTEVDNEVRRLGIAIPGPEWPAEMEMRSYHRGRFTVRVHKNALAYSLDQIAELINDELTTSETFYD